jgi:hypothetical protein
MEVSGQLQAMTIYPPGKLSPGCSVGPRAGLDTVEYRETTVPYRESNISRATRSYTDTAVDMLSFPP